MTLDVIKAIFLGIVEGLTEFIPVSSTGHLLLVGHFFGFDDDDFGKSFAVLIQLGAILALLSIYFGRLWKLFLGMFSDREAQRFIIGVLIAFFPAMVLGALLYGFIKGVLFNVWTVCIMLLIGGFVLLVDRPARPQAALPRRHQIPAADVSRHRRDPVPVHGAWGVARRRHHRRRHAVRRRQARGDGILVLAGDADHGRRLRVRSLQEPSRIRRRQQHADHRDRLRGVLHCGWFMVKTLFGYVSRHGFALFAWWRIVVGALGLIALTWGCKSGLGLS